MVIDFAAKVVRASSISPTATVTWTASEPRHKPIRMILRRRSSIVCLSVEASELRRRRFSNLYETESLLR